MRAPDRGAIAFWGPVGLSNDLDAATLNQGLYRAIFSDYPTTLGEAVLQAQAALAATGTGARYMYSSAIRAWRCQNNQSRYRRPLAA